MEIRIIALRLRNFKGVRSADYLFGGRNARIEGPNGSGKTTGTRPRARLSSRRSTRPPGSHTPARTTGWKRS